MLAGKQALIWIVSEYHILAAFAVPCTIRPLTDSF